jgi:hypothetical protein
MRNKYVIFLTCLLLFVAAVDTIPDPPAVKPASSPISRVFAFHARGTSTLPEKERRVVSSSRRRDRMDWFSLRLDVKKNDKPVCPVPLIRDAADSSPPIFS